MKNGQLDGRESDYYWERLKNLAYDVRNFKGEPEKKGIYEAGRKKEVIDEFQTARILLGEERLDEGKFIGDLDDLIRMSKDAGTEKSNINPFHTRRGRFYNFMTGRSVITAGITFGATALATVGTEVYYQYDRITNQIGRAQFNAIKDNTLSEWIDYFPVRSNQSFFYRLYHEGLNFPMWPYAVAPVTPIAILGIYTLWKSRKIANKLDWKKRKIESYVSEEISNNVKGMTGRIETGQYNK